LTDVLSELWRKHKLLNEFKKQMNSRGYVGRDLFVLDVQISLLNEIIKMESMNSLGELLRTKTYMRLLKEIIKGIEYLPDIVNSPEEWTLDLIENDSSAWIDNETLIFSIRNNIGVFSKITRRELTYKYVDGKFQ
jgi:hypothetical protein